jgi:hypothetical protein
MTLKQQQNLNKKPDTNDSERNQLIKKDVFNTSSQQTKLAAAAVAAAAAFALSPGSNSSKQTNFFPILMSNSEIVAKKD